MERVLETGCTVVWMHLPLLLCTLRNSIDAKFMLGYFTTAKKPKNKNKKTSHLINLLLNLTASSEISGSFTQSISAISVQSFFFNLWYQLYSFL